jgi:hypothetical protein
LGLFPLLEGPPHEVNNKSRLSSDEKKNYVMLGLTHADYKVDKMVKGYYQSVLQGIKSSSHFLLFLPHFKI